MERKPMIERVVDPLATGLGNGIGWLAQSGVLFAGFAVLWLVFGAALVAGHGSVDQAWTAIQTLPLPVRLVIWILLLPFMVGLWVWETSWPLLVRVVLVVGIAGWNLVMFLPRAATVARV